MKANVSEGGGVKKLEDSDIPTLVALMLMGLFTAPCIGTVDLPGAD